MLLVGVPGLAKTKLVHSLGIVLGLDANRIQCTPDLMPSDILGSEVLEEDKKGTKSFRFIEGPVFAQLLMADEINRASPRTQSALLEAMQEKTVTIAGHDHSLPKPFHVMATQNPIEQEGTYPLPEAQLDRFLMQIPISYPSRDAERDILLQTGGLNEKKPKKVLSAKQLIAAQEAIRDLPIGEKLLDQVLELVRALRPETSNHHLVQEHVQWGPGPRAGQALIIAARSYALLNGREAPLLDDVIALASPVLRHRIGLSFQARGAGLSEDKIIADICETL